MTKVLNDIKERNHDSEVCFFNCKKNGAVFNQIPYQCRYFKGSSMYEDLLKYQEIPNIDVSDDGTFFNPNIKEFYLQLIMFEEYKEEIDLECRNKEDLIKVENSIEDL